ncbi:hypothetical protein K1719_018250 [Acacia pycnantha]|nr:hypothetical protein K1719_018250 [Acacia pycnantha]
MSTQTAYTRSRACVGWSDFVTGCLASIPPLEGVVVKFNVDGACWQMARAQLLSRVILTKGTFTFAYITYRYIVATLCVAPFAFYFERSETPRKEVG